MKVPEQPTHYRVFLREPGNPFRDFTELDEAWEYAQSFRSQGAAKIPYVFPIRPGGPQFPVQG